MGLEKNLSTHVYAGIGSNSLIVEYYSEGGGEPRNHRNQIPFKGDIGKALDKLANSLLKVENYLFVSGFVRPLRENGLRPLVPFEISYVAEILRKAMVANQPTPQTSS